MLLPLRLAGDPPYSSQSSFSAGKPQLHLLPSHSSLTIPITEINLYIVYKYTTTLACALKQLNQRKDFWNIWENLKSKLMNYYMCPAITDEGGFFREGNWVLGILAFCCLQKCFTHFCSRPFLQLIWVCTHLTLSYKHHRHTPTPRRHLGDLI